jgi:hypothetical protein
MENTDGSKERGCKPRLQPAEELSHPITCFRQIVIDNNRISFGVLIHFGRVEWL